MKFLMLLSALATWVTGKRPEKKPALRWLKPGAGTTVRMVPPPPLPLHLLRHDHTLSKQTNACQGADCPLCDAGHPSKAAMYLRATTAMHDRRPEQDSPYRHGWYSAENDRKLGHYFCKATDGRVVKVTNATQSPTGGLAGWPDAVYVGELASPTPCPPPLPMTEKRASFVAAFLRQVFSGRQVVASHAWREHSTSHSGRIGVVDVSPTGGNWSVRFNLGGRAWFLDGRVGIHWGADGPELWSETTTASGAVVRDTFAPEGGYLGPEDRDIWGSAKRALWIGRYHEDR